MVRPSTIIEAYAILGLEQGSSLEEVKSAYRQLALRTHPDKNPGNEDATAQFQRVSEAYSALVKHLDRSAPSPRSRFSPFSPDFDDDEYNDYDDYDDQDNYYNEEDEELAFHLYMFSQFLQGRFFSSRSHYRNTHQMRPRSSTPESPEQYRARLAQARERQILAEERRAMEQAKRKAAQEREREQERKAAEVRQKAKSAGKKAQAEKGRKDAANAARNQRQRVQALRSAVFTAARNNDAENVKKGVWEDEVDPSGGEIKAGGEEFVHVHPKDPQETLLHIAAFNGDADMVKWLDAHSADYEERNSLGFTAFHIALQHGHIPVLNYFFKVYDPKSEDYVSIYAAPSSKSVLSIALDSAKPEVIWMILNKGLSSTQDIGNAWTWVSSSEGKQSLLKKLGTQRHEIFEEIRTLLMTFGGFTPPPTPKTPSQKNGKQGSFPSDSSRQNGSTLPTKDHDSKQKQNRNNQRRYKKEARQQGSQSKFLDQPTATTIPPLPLPTGSGVPVGANLKPSFNSDRGRGRGRGGGRGRGRGRGGPLSP